MSVYDDHDDPRPDGEARQPPLLPDDELHKVEDAHITCRSAWLYPLDHDIRAAAYFAVSRIGFDYVELLAATMERGDHGKGMSAEAARRAVAESFRKLGDQSYAQVGYTPPTVAPLLSDPDTTPDPLDPRGGDGLDAIGGP